MAIWMEPIPEWMEGEMTTVVKMDDHRRRKRAYVACFSCDHDWIAEDIVQSQWPLACPRCNDTTGEEVRYWDAEWFKRFTAGGGKEKRTLILLNAARMRSEKL